MLQVVKTPVLRDVETINFFQNYKDKLMYTPFFKGAFACPDFETRANALLINTQNDQDGKQPPSNTK